MKIPYRFNPFGLESSGKNALMFTALQDSSYVKIKKTGEPVVSGLQYRTNLNGTWTPWMKYVINSQIDLDEGDKIQFKNLENQLSISASDYAQFEMSGSIGAEGNVQSLLHGINYVPNFSFERLFQNCTALTSAPILPVLTVGNYGYFYMFAGCTSLTEAPDLPATSIGLISYANMFIGCTSLTKIPSILPAMSVPQQAYQAIFNGCTSLSGAPELPATTLGTGSYQSMFENCTSLISAPELPATTLTTSCYYRMFANCTSLVNGPSELPSENIGNYSYGGMFIGCTKLKNAPHIHLTNLLSSQVDYASFMFSEANPLSSLNVDLINWDNSPTRNWLYHVSPSGSFYCPAELKIPSRDASGVPSGWNIYPKDVQLGQIIEENGVQKFGILSFNGTSSTVERSESFENVYSFNKINNKPYKRRVEYLECTGSQYINTGVAPDFANGDSIEISFYKALTSNSNSCIFGSRQSPALSGFYALRLALVACDDNGFVQVGWSNPPDGDYTLQISDEYVISNGRSYTMPKRVTCAYPMYLFALNQNDSPLGDLFYIGCKIYKWKYFKNGVLTQYLIPVIDNNDVPCLYDVISNNLIYNSGTGTFGYGELQGEDVIELGQIIEDNGIQKFGSLEFDGTTPILKNIKAYTNAYEYNKAE